MPQPIPAEPPTTPPAITWIPVPHDKPSIESLDNHTRLILWRPETLATPVEITWHDGRLWMQTVNGYDPIIGW